MLSQPDWKAVAGSCLEDTVSLSVCKTVCLKDTGQHQMAAAVLRPNAALFGHMQWYAPLECATLSSGMS